MAVARNASERRRIDALLIESIEFCDRCRGVEAAAEVVAAAAPLFVGARAALFACELMLVGESGIAERSCNGGVLLRSSGGGSISPLDSAGRLRIVLTQMEVGQVSFRCKLEGTDLFDSPDRDPPRVVW